MADDEHLLDLLARALDPGDPQPPPERVAALRIRAAASGPQPTGPASEVPRTAEPAPAEPVPLRPSPVARPAPSFWLRRGRWVAASVAAAAVILAAVALPVLLHDRTPQTSVASGNVSDARQAVARLRAALLTRDPVTIAKADAELLRQTRSLPAPERRMIADDAVAAHVDAIEFLHEHPAPEAVSEVPQETVPLAENPPGPVPPAGELPSTVPDSGPVEPTTTLPTPVPAVTPPEARTVAITAVTATVDGTFAVEFAVSGFVPDASGTPGTYAIRFSFDDDKSPTVWDGPSPWGFPSVDAVRYHEVCARVVDAAGVEDPASGGCHEILPED